MEPDRLSTRSSVTTDPGDRHVHVLNELMDRSSIHSVITKIILVQENVF